MTKEMYFERLIKTFNETKKIIKEGKQTVVIEKSKEKYTKFEIPAFGNFPDIKISSITEEQYSHSDYIHLAGVNVLFFLVCIYLIIEKNNTGIYYEYKNPGNKNLEMKERIEILKKTSFIFEKDEKGFWYYPISELKNTPLFIFDLTEMNSESND